MEQTTESATVENTTTENKATERVAIDRAVDLLGITTDLINLAHQRKTQRTAAAALRKMIMSNPFRIRGRDLDEDLVDRIMSTLDPKVCEELRATHRADNIDTIFNCLRKLKNKRDRLSRLETQVMPNGEEQTMQHYVSVLQEFREQLDTSEHARLASSIDSVLRACSESLSLRRVSVSDLEVLHIHLDTYIGRPRYNT